MTIKSFIRDTAYFQVARDRGMMPTAENYDIQFNQFVKFINDKITPIIDVITVDQLFGEVGKSSTFLKNIGDGTTSFVTLTNEMLTDYDIEWKKLKKAPPASILATNSSNEFIAITADAKSKVLVSQQDDAPVWKLLNSDNVQINNITGDKFIFNAIGTEHLDPTVLGRPLGDESVEEAFIAEQAITGIKTSFGSITPAKIESTLLAQARVNISFGADVNDNVLTSRNFADGSIIFDQYFKDKKLLSLDNIADNSLYLQPLPDVVAANRIDPYYYIGDGAVHPYHIMPKTYITGLFQSYPTGYAISKEKLSPAIRRALEI